MLGLPRPVARAISFRDLPLFSMRSARILATFFESAIDDVCIFLGALVKVEELEFLIDAFAVKL